MQLLPMLQKYFHVLWKLYLAVYCESLYTRLTSFFFIPIVAI